MHNKTRDGPWRPPGQIVAPLQIFLLVFRLITRRFGGTGRASSAGMSHLMARTIRPYDQVRHPLSRSREARRDVGLVAWALFGVVVGSLLVHGFTSPRSLSLRLQQAATAVHGAASSVWK